MHVSTTTLQPIFEGVKQYIIPLFQRTYCWNKQNWDTLWNDIWDLYTGDSPNQHFMGSIVTIPTQTVPEGVAKYLIIDGQQRLTTFYLLLLVIRDIARHKGDSQYSEEISETLLVNKFKSEQQDYYKLLPTQIDRASLIRLVIESVQEADSNIASCYSYFHRQITKNKPELSKLVSLITKKLSLVSIVLEPADDPYIVFESLNNKGKPLSSSDLIRNYFFMKIHTDKQEDVYDQIWLPMQKSLGEKLPDFVRHYLMKDGSFVNIRDVYSTLKERINKDNDAEQSMRELKKYAGYYKNLLDPKLEENSKIRNGLDNLSSLDMATTYPFLLNIYEDFKSQRIDVNTFSEALKVIENFVVRRFICGIPTNQLNKIFPAVYSQMQEPELSNFGYVQKIQIVLQSKNYPKDAEIKPMLSVIKLYGTGRNNFGRLILERIEQSFAHREMVELGDSIQIEHIMPQTLTPDWEIHLGENAKEIYEKYLNTIGNLTLTGYNPQLSNSSFAKKRELYKDSHIDMNRYFSDNDIERWDESQIQNRANTLIEQVVDKVYPYFGTEEAINIDSPDVTSSKPRMVQILGEEFPCETWIEALELTLKTIAELEPEKLELLTTEYPSLIGTNDNFRRSKSLSNGYWFEANLNAKTIYLYCNQIINSLGLSQEDWKISLSA